MMGNVLLHLLYSTSHNDSRNCKPDEGLISTFKMFILHAGHCDCSSFSHLNMLPNNLNKIGVCI